MPYKFIGRRTDFKGKSLWEIVGNLKNFGIGRLVIRQMFQRYSEPCYMKILKVEPLPCPVVQSPDNLRKVRVTVEETFRGITSPSPTVIELTSYKTDYQLIPKDEEHLFYNSTKKAEQGKIFPKYMEFPPLFNEIIIREMQNRGEEIKEKPKLKIVYNSSILEKHKIAEDGETPTIEIGVGLGTTVSPSLYENIRLK